MFRNREIQIFSLVIIMVIAILTAVAALFFSKETMVFAWITAGILIGTMYIFMKWRYREIRKLSSYLRRIRSGDYSFDVRDNYEGELSILKSDIYKVTSMLAEQGSRLQRDKLQLSDAVSDISHQLKTPLTSMMVMADLLSNSGIEEEKRKEFTRNLQVQLERIEWLILSLLKLSKIDAGTAIFKKEKVIVKELIQKAVEPILIPMDIKQQVWTVSGEDTVSFQGDLNWTAEAVINIIKNCVEHTGYGGKISASFTENALYTNIVISDNGNGIPKEDLPYIFKRFYKGKNAGEDSIGIGLAMAYSIVKNQGGDIEATSESGKGTSFSIKFYKQVI